MPSSGDAPVVDDWTAPKVFKCVAAVTLTLIPVLYGN